MSRYIVTILMIWYLNKSTVLSVPSVKSLHFGGYLKSVEFAADIFGIGNIFFDSC